ncbi:helix-turn-helix transcriptional regulator [Streptomyces mirabilis]|uniref:helix-turn-helix transcriptional regulator n=1 Tax=Streptomyces mirabilis TaxID=68239 RepID=UPI0036DD69B2
MRLEEVIGTNIAERRSHKELSQTELGEALGQYLEKPWSRQAVHTAEKGRRAFTAAELIALALVLEVELPELLAPPLAARHEEVELPRGSVNGRALSDIVSPETPEAWERRANMDMVAHITPMLGGVISTLQILQVSLQGILQEAEDDQAVNDPSSASAVARRKLELRSQLNAALADLIGQSQIGKEREAAIKRLEEALRIASGEGGDG